MSSARFGHAVCVLATALIIPSMTAAQAPRDSWRRDVACGSDLPRLKPAGLPSCVIALCGDASPIRSKICACLKSDKTGDTEVQIFGPGREQRRISTIVSQFSLDAEDFRVIRGDFLGDGGSQLLFAARNITSSGMAVEHWSLWVIGADFVSRPIDANDFGVMSFLTGQPGGKCKVFAATWRDGWEPRRGDGLYIVGVWHELLDGDLLVDSDRPALYRRYLFELQNRRNRSFGPRRTLEWHKSSLARPVFGPYPGE